MSRLFPSGDQNIGASASVPPMNSGLISFRVDWLDLLAVQGDSQESSPAQLKSLSSWVLSLLYGPSLTGVCDYWKNHTSDHTDKVHKPHRSELAAQYS